MTPIDRNADEEALAALLAQYDEALAGETPLQPPAPSTIGWNSELVAECDRAKHCLELLDRVRRRWSPPDAKADVASGNSIGAMSTASGVVTIGRFRVERELGRGGIGIVHLAFDPNLGRQVALKVPRFDLLANDDLRRRFLREAEAAARLSHPNLVTVFEAGEDGPICFLTSEYCAGPTLAKWLKLQDDPVDASFAALVVRKLALAVQHAHGRGVLHRDIKPSNILLDTNADGDLPWQPKLTDFGMAKLLERAADETRTGVIIGTPAYMAPEQAEGRVRELDARTDLYALGAVLYELLTRRAPADGETDAESLRKVLCEEPITPRRLRQDLPRDLEAICLKCLARRPEQRYTTVQELADDLQRFLDLQPTEARPLSALGMALKWARRRPTAASVIAMTFVGWALLVMGGVAYTLKIRRHAEELSEVLAARDVALATAHAHADATARSYPADMRLAQQAWKQGRNSDARVLLDKHRPHSADLDHRSFAWHFLWRLCDRKEATLAGHHGPIYVCRYAPDGQRLATAGDDGHVRLWNAATGTSLRSWQAHDGDINGILFSPDGNCLVTTTGERGAAIWETATGRPLYRFETLKGMITAAAYSPDGQTLFVGSNTGIVTCLNTGDCSTRAEFAAVPDPIQLLAISYDGALLATASTDNTIRIWNLPDMSPLVALDGHTRDVTALSFSHDGSKLCSASHDGTVRLWRFQKRGQLACYESKTGYVHDVTFTPDDARVLLAGHMGDTQIWELVTDKCELVLRSGVTPVYSIAVSPNGEQVATGGADAFVHLWEASPDPEKVRLVTDVPGRTVAVSHDGSQAAIADFDGRVSNRRLATGEQLNLLDTQAGIDAMAFSERGDLQAVGFHDGTIRLWHLPDMTPLYTLTGHTDRIWNIRFSADGKLLSSCSNDRFVRIWDTRSGIANHGWLTTNDNPQDVAFSPDGDLLAAAYRSGAIRVWRVSDGVQAGAWSEPGAKLLCLSWSPDGKLLASGAENNTLCIWDADRFSLVRRISDLESSVASLCFSPDGKTLASGLGQGTIRLWDTASHEELLQLTAHRDLVNQLFFSAAGDALYSFAPGQRCELFRWSIR